MSTTQIIYGTLSATTFSASTIFLGNNQLTAVTQFTGGTISGSTTFTNGLSANTISATTYQNLPDNVIGRYLPLSGGTITGSTTFSSGLTSTTISATTYQNLPQTTSTNTATIHFSSSTIFGSYTSPLSTNITDNLTGSKLGITQKIYHNSGTSPSVPAGWVLLGSTTYQTSVVNIIYAEWSEGSRVEYWIVR